MPDSKIAAHAARPLYYDWREWLANSLTDVLSTTIDGDIAPQRLVSLSATKLAALDQSIRRNAFRLNEGLHRDHRTLTLPVHRPRDDIDALLFLYACDVSGYVREQVIVALHDYPGRIAIAAALIRCGDWVEPVQQAAVDLLKALLAGEHAADLFGQLDLLLPLRERKRVADRVWPKIIAATLRDARHADARMQAALVGTTDARLFALELVHECEPQRLPPLCRELVCGPDIGVALWALRVASKLDEGAGVIASALNSPHAAVRAEVLRRHVDGDARATLERFLFDPARAPRNAAAHLLRSRHGVEAIVTWRQALDGPPSRHATIALAALSDHANADDIDRLVPWLSDPRAPQRIAALDALTRLRAPALDGHLAQALTDTQPRVVRNALRNYRIVRRMPPSDVLRRAYAQATERAPRKALARSLPQLGKWDALDLLLEWSAEPGVAFHAYLAPYLKLWMHRAVNRFTPITPAEKAGIAKSIVRLRARGTDLAVPFAAINTLEILVEQA